MLRIEGRGSIIKTRMRAPSYQISSHKNANLYRKHDDQLVLSANESSLSCSITSPLSPNNVSTTEQFPCQVHSVYEVQTTAS